MRNHDLILNAARHAFETEGIGVPIHEIARRAGVGQGTVTRHFPTKDDLVSALVYECVDRLVAFAGETDDAATPAKSLFRLIAQLVDDCAANAGLNEALTAAGVDVNDTFPDAQRAILGLLADRLQRAQHSGAVRADIDAQDVAALIIGCAGRLRGALDSRARDRLLDVLETGLRPGSRSDAAASPQAPAKATHG